MLKEKKMEFCHQWIRRIQDDNDKLKDSREEALKYFFADKLGDEKKGRSSVVVATLQETLNWVKPVILETFAGGDDIVSLMPTKEEDVESVELLKDLVNHQTRVKNKWFIIIHDTFETAGLMKFGGIKYQWYTDIKKSRKAWKGITEDQFKGLLASEKGIPVDYVETVIQEASIDPTGLFEIPAIKSIDVTFEYTTKDSYPLLESVPAEEIGFPLDTREISEAPFFYHRTKLEGWKISRTYGKDVLKKIEASSKDKAEGKAIQDSTTDQRFQDIGGLSFMYDEKENKYWVYECYYYDPADGTPRMNVICGDVECNDFNKDINPYSRPPFEVFTPYKLAHRVCGLSFHDVLKQMQKLLSVLMRHMLDNVYFANNGRYIGDSSRVNVDQFLNNNVPGGWVDGDPSAVKALEVSPLQPWVFQLLENAFQLVEYRSGVPRSFQGVNRSVLNKTFRGQAQQIQQASQRIQMMIRLFAEMTIVPLVRDIIDMNEKFLEDETAIRVLGKWKTIRPDNLSYHANVIANVGTGTTDKREVVLEMQQLLGVYGQIKKAGIPIVTAQNVYNAMAELVKAMGRKNTHDFITDPKQSESVMALVQMFMALAQQMAKMGQPIPPQAQMVVQQVMANFGMGSAPGAGNAPNEPVPEQPEQPAQAMNASTTPAGGEYFG